MTGSIVLFKDGRVYMVDFEILEDIPFYGHNDENLENRYTCSALGLFYVKGNGDIVPIAIQFHQVPSETNPIWTPNDSELDWIYAKMWLRNADTQYHQVSAKYLINGVFPSFRFHNHISLPRFRKKRRKFGIVRHTKYPTYWLSSVSDTVCCNLGSHYIFHNEYHPLSGPSVRLLVLKLNEIFKTTKRTEAIV